MSNPGSRVMYILQQQRTYKVDNLATVIPKSDDKELIPKGCSICLEIEQIDRRVLAILDTLPNQYDGFWIRVFSLQESTIAAERLFLGVSRQLIEGLTGIDNWIVWLHGIRHAKRLLFLDEIFQHVKVRHGQGIIDALFDGRMLQRMVLATIPENFLGLRRTVVLYNLSKSDIFFLQQ